jgi:thiol-disulfide isomerase/thioredoxin
MTSVFNRRLALAAATLGLLVQSHASAVALSDVPQPKPWSESTWVSQLKRGPRPAAYLFTTSYCSTCPEAFEVLSQAVKAQKKKVALIPVIMDLDGEKARRHAVYFDGMTELYTFDGFEPVLRQSIDPQWPNVTPYIVLIDGSGTVQKMIGPPDAQALTRWLR